MRSCQICQGETPLSETGQIVFSSDNSMVIAELYEQFQHEKADRNDRNTLLYLPYHSWEELKILMIRVEDYLRESDRSKLRGKLITNEGQEKIEGNEFTLDELREQVEQPKLVKIIQEKLFRSFVQPIIDAKSSKTYGYEFLLRPNSKLYPFNPGELFAFSQRSGLQSKLDSQARINAIRTSAHKLEPGTKRFINFLPSSIYNPKHCLQSTFQAARDYDVNPYDLVFEVVETEKITDLDHLKFIFSEYQQAGMKTALDDVGSGYATLEVLQELKPDYAKIDRELVKDIHIYPEKIEKIKAIRAVTGKMSTMLLAEGIESQLEYEAVKPLVDYAQGYYFGKPAVIPE
ncbi:EAL domain-containing protein [Alkalicoccus halolimnae]|uniref:EAL domain-containing protein n=1 Tax=Alkalicoccus halolimnae TaxID=1667239 RepID=A0A5C7F7A4_9BACI|nr:EAL domain-containing protein [Alkalicoccus halolimnae]TXF85883.1 EAL domain-containing protein [Alkalicoccus halolimnae]